MNEFLGIVLAWVVVVIFVILWWRVRRRLLDDIAVLKEDLSNQWEGCKELYRDVCARVDRRDGLIAGQSKRIDAAHEALREETKLREDLRLSADEWFLRITKAIGMEGGKIGGTRLDIQSGLIDKLGSLVTALEKEVGIKDGSTTGTRLDVQSHRIGKLTRRVGALEKPAESKSRARRTKKG